MNLGLRSGDQKDLHGESHQDQHPGGERKKQEQSGTHRSRLTGYDRPAEHPSSTRHPYPVSP